MTRDTRDANHVAVERLARYLWTRETANLSDANAEEDWTAKITSYREEAKTILHTQDG